jgi:hypothetical protein
MQAFRDFSAYDPGHSVQTRLLIDMKTYRTPQFERYYLDTRQWYILKQVFYTLFMAMWSQTVCLKGESNRICGLYQTV